MKIYKLKKNKFVPFIILENQYIHNHSSSKNTNSISIHIHGSHLLTNIVAQTLLYYTYQKIVIMRLASSGVKLLQTIACIDKYHKKLLTSNQIYNHFFV